MPADLKRLPKHLGEAVRELQTKAGISQLALAEKADLSLNFVGEVERGETLASLETVVRLASGLGIKGSALLAKAGL